ncbi:MAG TPA: lipid II flippase MurJ, partial [Thermoanaerobaculia bacterium]|nr:lipid II flippase MurJ [Thermoanaerobaculia bacterium]
MSERKPALPALYVLLVGASAGSALFGFAREAVIGALFGATRATDAYYSGLTIPFVAAYFLVGGALAPPLAASLAAALARGAADEARALFAHACRAVLVPGAAVAIAVAVFASPLARLLVPGFGAEDVRVTARLLALLCPYGLLTSFALLISAALTAAGSYRSPAVALLFGNGVSVAVLVLGTRAGLGIDAAAIAMDAGAVVFAAGLLLPLRKTPLWGRAVNGIAPALPWRDAGLLTLSLALAGTVDLAERPFASTAGVGVVALLAFSSKLIHLPMRLVAAPLAWVAFPRFVRSRSAGSGVEGAKTARGVFDLLLFSGAVTAAAAGPIAAITFGRGRFDAHAVAELARALTLLAPAVVAVGFLEMGVKLLLAAGGASDAAWAQGAGLAAYLVAAPLLVSRGLAGLAVARDIAWVTAALVVGAALARRARELALFTRLPVRL